MGLKSTKSFKGKGSGFHEHPHEHSVNALAGWDKRLKDEYGKPLTLSEAKKIHESRSPRSQKSDERKTAKNVLKPNTFRANKYIKNPNRYDVEGIDTKKERIEIKKEEKIKPDISNLLKEKQYTNLSDLYSQYDKINEAIYVSNDFSNKELKKLEQSREKILQQKNNLESELSETKEFHYENYSDGTALDIDKNNNITLKFDYKTYKNLSNSEQSKIRSSARWNPDRKVWTVYPDKKNDIFEVLTNAGLIPKEKTPQREKTLREIYFKEKATDSDSIVIKTDENSNIATIDCDDKMLRKLDEYYSFYVDGYEYTPSYQAGRWDGKIHLIRQYDKTLPTNMAYNILDEKNNISGDMKLKIIDYRKNAKRTDKYDVKGITLYDYQKEAIEKAINEKQGLIVAATGSGKTEIASGILAEYGRDSDAVFLVHTTALQDQAEKRLETRLGTDVGIGGGTRHDINITDEGDINVVTVQSLQKALKSKKEGKILTDKQKELIKAYEDSEVVIQDEAHHVKAETFKEVIDTTKTKHVYGLSATPYRDKKDEKLVFSRFGKKVIEITPDELIRKGKLVPPTIHMISIEQSPEVKYIGGKGAKKYAKIREKQIVDNEDRNKKIKELITKQYKKGKTTLVFVDRIEHGEKLAKEVDAPFLNGQDTTKRAREQNQKVIDDVKAGKVKTIIATQQLFGEGFDLPAIDSLIIADAGGASKVRTMQVAGRALRTKEGKKEAEIFDFDDKTEYLHEHAQKRIDIYKQHSEFKVIV